MIQNVNSANCTNKTTGSQFIDVNISEHYCKIMEMKKTYKCMKSEKSLQYVKAEVCSG